MQFPILFIKFYKGGFLQFERKYGIINTCTCSWIVKIVSHKCLAVSCCVSIKDNKILGPNMSRSVYRYNVSLCYLCVSLTVSVVSVKRQEVTETAKSVTETSRTNRNFTMAVLYVMITYVSKENNLGPGDKIRYIWGLKGPIFIL